MSAQPSKPALEVRGDRSSLDAAKLEELVALELGADAARVSRVTIEVRGGRASVEVRLGEERRDASVSLAAAEPERALALFVAELARGASGPASPPPPAASSPPPAAPAPSAADSPPPPLPAAAPSPAAPTTSWRFSALGTMGARVMTRGPGGALLATPRIELGVRQQEALRIGATARYGYASADDPLGTVRAHALAGGLAGTFVLLSSASLALATGPRVEIGLVSGRGDGSNSRATTALTLGGSWEVELHVKLGGITLLGAFEVGTLVRGAQLRADDRDVLQLAGPLVGLSGGLML